MTRSGWRNPRRVVTSAPQSPPCPIVTYNSGHPFNLLAGADINGDSHFTNDRPPGAGRNTGLGPNYVSLDMRVSRSITFADRYKLQFIAEGFNVTNRTNYASVNNIVGATFAPPFSVHGTATISLSQPLGFTAAFPKREIQVGIHLISERGPTRTSEQRLWSRL